MSLRITRFFYINKIQLIKKIVNTQCNSVPTRKQFPPYQNKEPLTNKVLRLTVIVKNYQKLNKQKEYKQKNQMGFCVEILSITRY